METPVERHAMLFAWLAREAVVRRGIDGESAVLEGVRRYGEQRGRRMAARAQADGCPLDYVSYRLYGELDFASTGNVFQMVQGVPYVAIHTAPCDWHRVWSERGLLVYGGLYCREIDRAIVRGFNPDFGFAVDGTLSDGAPCCRFLYYDGRFGPAEKRRYTLGMRRVGTSAVRPWDYHVAHLYRTMSDVLAEYLGDEGRAGAEAALAAFADAYGVDAVAAVRATVLV